MPHSRPVRLAVASLAVCALAACAERRIDAAPAGGGALIVELEGRFAAASRARGARAAFLEFLAEDSIVLRPGPVWGRAAWEAAQDSPATLDWRPDRAQLAADGRFGYSTGPWTLTGDDGARLEGRYVTVWRQDSDGWRVVFDGGLVGSGAASQGAARLDEARCQRDPTAQAGDLQALDLGLSAGAFGRQLRRVAAPGLVLFHAPDAAGVEGAAALEATFEALPPSTQLLPMGAGHATSGDLGYTYGLAAPSAEASADAAYLHIWCRAADGWRLLLGLRTPLPAPAGQDPSEGADRRD